MPAKNFELRSFADTDELAARVAGLWLDEIESANGAGKTYCVALSGGRIAQKFFATTVEQVKRRAVSFERVHFFWADERCVPPTDPESNFKLASELLFAPLKIPANQIHRIRGEEPPEAAGKTAGEEIARFVSLNSDNQPILDLIFLGMGEDGHVASLFPGENEAAISAPAIYRAIRKSPKPPPDRITLGYAAIAKARQVWVLVSGAGKAAALRDSLRPEGRTPLARILLIRSQTKIFSDIRLD